MTHRKDILIVRSYGEGPVPDQSLNLIHKKVPRTMGIVVHTFDPNTQEADRSL